MQKEDEKDFAAKKLLILRGSINVKQKDKRPNTKSIFTGAENATIDPEQTQEKEGKPLGRENISMCAGIISEAVLC